MIGRVKLSLLVLSFLTLPALAGTIQIPCPNGVAPGSADTVKYAGFALDELVSLFCEKLTPETTASADAVVNAAATETNTPDEKPVRE